MVTTASVMNLAVIAAALAFGAWTTSADAKECYAPDARAQERAVSRAVVTEGGKTIWLAGQTRSPNSNFDGQTREIFHALDKTIKAVGGNGLKDGHHDRVHQRCAYGDRLTEIREETFPRDELYTADEVFFTGTAAEITPVREVDFRPVGTGIPGPLTRRLQEMFFAAVRGREPRHRTWLSPVRVPVASNP